MAVSKEAADDAKRELELLAASKDEEVPHLWHDDGTSSIRLQRAERNGVSLEPINS